MPVCWEKVLDEFTSPSQIADLCGSLLRHPSPQTELFEDEPQVKEFIRDEVYCRLQGLNMKTIELDSRGNLIATCGPGNCDRSLLWISYGMAAAPSTMPEPYSGALLDGQAWGVEGKVLWGRGACEQKGALAAMLAALQVVTRWGGLQGRLIFITSTAGETGRHDSVQGIVEERDLRAQQAVIGLGTNNRICLGNKGRVDLDIVVKGRSAHSSAPWLGKNAVDGARIVLDALDKLEVKATHPHLGQNSLTITSIKTLPQATHTVPGECRISVDRRLLPGESPEGAIARIEDMLKSLTGVEDFSITLERGPFMYPAEVAPEAPVAKGLAQAFRRATGNEGTFTYSHSALDAGYLIRQGIETVMFGPGDPARAHTDREIVPLQQVVEAARTLAVQAIMVLS